MGVRNAAYNLQCWADNIVVTMGGGIADEDKHDNEDNIYHNDLDESVVMIESITLTLLLYLTLS